jgi:hypothetical protein
MAEASIRIKLGQLEVDYQGDSDFLKSDLMNTVNKLLTRQMDRASAYDAADTPEGSQARPQRGGKLNHSTSTMATLLGAKSGPDLIVAAAAHLHLAGGKNQYTRAELLDAMRAAPSHYRKTYASNLSRYLTTLTKADDLRLVGNDTYALSANKATDIEAKLAQAK